MSPERNEQRGGAPARVCVVHAHNGGWEVLSFKGRVRITCETLDDARRIAYLSVAEAGDCELVVRDAYERVLEHGRFSGKAPS